MPISVSKPTPPSKPQCPCRRPGCPGCRRKNPYCPECDHFPCRCHEVIPNQPCPKCRAPLSDFQQGMKTCGGCGRCFRCPGCLLNN